MRIPRAIARLAVLGVLALGVCGSARADEGDPPARVARLSYVEGAVSLEPAGIEEWTAAERNRPLTTGDRLWTDQGSVAELDLGDAVLRLGGMTGFAFLSLDDRLAQIDCDLLSASGAQFPKIGRGETGRGERGGASCSDAEWGRQHRVGAAGDLDRLRPLFGPTGDGQNRAQRVVCHGRDLSNPAPVLA